MARLVFDPIDGSRASHRAEGPESNGSGPGRFAYDRIHVLLYAGKLNWYLLATLNPVAPP